MIQSSRCSTANALTSANFLVKYFAERCSCTANILLTTKPEKFINSKKHSNILKKYLISS